MDFARLTHALRSARPSQQLTARLLFAAALLCAPTTFARPQVGGGPPIRVGSDEVFVPVSFVPAAGWGLQARSPENLKSSDFRLFEDGKEQKIQQVTVEHYYDRLFVVPGVDQWEKAWVPGQEWLRLESEPPSSKRFIWGNADAFYVMGYVPPPSPYGSCHYIRVKVHHESLEAVAPDEYCKARRPPSDPLFRTPLGNRLEDFATSGTPSKIPLSLNVHWFYRDTKTARLYVTAEFPPSAIRFRSVPNGLRDKIGILTMVYRNDGTLAARLSDLSEDRGPLTDGSGDLVAFADSAKGFIPNSHEAQIDLSPGDYSIEVVLSDGTKLGRARALVTVDAYDAKQLGISSIAMCAHYHDQRRPLPTDDALSTVSNFVPLVSKGMEFIPAGDTNFSAQDLKEVRLLFVYYEIYEPLLADAPTTSVQTCMRIVNTNTGAVETSTGFQSAADWIHPGNSVIPISQQIAADKLPKGTYRIEIQASDSAGRTTPWRTATFTIY